MIEVVRDIFITDKLGRDGLRYGFMRFGGNVDIVRVQQKVEWHLD